MEQGDFSVSAPQISQKIIFSRAEIIVSANCFTIAESVCTKCNAMRSAERGPTPGNLLKAAVSETIGSGNIKTKAEGGIENAEIKRECAAWKTISSFCFLPSSFSFHIPGKLIPAVILPISELEISLA
jgi:hypothetical protein